MRADEVAALVERQISGLRCDPPEGTVGTPFSSERVASAIELNGYLVVFDPESQRFGLAVAGESRPPETVAVWGDLVSTFMAR